MIEIPKSARQAKRLQAKRDLYSRSALASASAALLLLLAAAPAAAVSLGTAGNFGVLAGSTATNTGTTTVNGNVGVSPGTAVTGFPPGVVVGGAIHSNDSAAIQAQSDLTTAYNDITATSCTADLTGQDLGGKTLTPGVYCFSSSAGLTGTLTLDALGNPNAEFIFKIGSTLTTASASSVLVISQGSSCHVFWQVGSSATLGTTTSFAGNILALTSITLTTSATVSGRALARNGAVTMDTNKFTSCPAAANTTVGAGGIYPPGTTFNGVPINALQSGYGVEIGVTGSGFGEFCTILLGINALGLEQNITIVGNATSGSRTGPNIATFSGTASVDMGDGTPPAPGVPFTATITTDANSQGSIGLVIGVTTLPNAVVNAGSMTIR